MSQQLRRSMGLRADQRHEMVLIGSPEPTRSRSAERSSSVASNDSWDCADGVSHTNSNKSSASRNRPGSGTVGSNGHSCMQRSNSDPFDDGGDELVQAPDPVERVGKTDTVKQDQIRKVKALPTLYRFPCTQTRNQNCWSETPAEMFTVRGHNYMNGDKTKIRCKHYLLQSRGCDLFNTQDNNRSINDIILEGGLGGNIRKKPTFLFRFLFPWGMLIQYYEVPPKLVPFMKMGMTNDEKRKLSIKGFSNAEKVLARWFASDDAEYKNERLKLIAIVPEGPWIVRNLVTGKPALIGKRLQVSYKYIPRKSNLVECLQICDLDISSGTAIAKKTVGVTRRYLSSLQAVDIGFVIEGNSPAELPEEMMGSTRLHQVDPTQAPSV
jgi:hypothetical protein